MKFVKLSPCQLVCSPTCGHNCCCCCAAQVISFLSFADFYRPRYFLLENVKTFATHNSSMTLRLALRSLLDMGYQVYLVLEHSGWGVRRSLLLLLPAPCVQVAVVLPLALCSLLDMGY
jgi:hypothetical protein